MGWVNHDPASRLPLPPLLYDAVCLALLSPAALPALAAMAAEGVGAAFVHAAIDRQNDPALRPELGHGALTAAVGCVEQKVPYWSDLTQLSLARHAACAAVWDGCLFVCGGISINGLWIS